METIELIKLLDDCRERFDAIIFEEARTRK